TKTAEEEHSNMNRITCGISITTLLVCAASAQTDDGKCPAVSFGTFPYTTKRFYFFSSPGTPAGQAKHLDSYAPDDFPPCSEVWIEDPRGYPSLKKGPRYMFAAKNIVRVYNVSAVTRAPYKTIQSHLKHLRELLKKRPIKVPSGEFRNGEYAELEQLPDYPPRNAGHLLQVKMHYLDAPWGSGLF